MAGLSFELVSPDKRVLAATADMVVVPGSEGDFAVLAGHAPLISALRAGTIDIYQGDAVSERFYVGGGFAEVALDSLTILAEEAIPLAELDRERLGKDIANAREDVEDAKSDDARARAQDKLDRLQHILESL
jgi:F-type H+-transporting ATPase subunit epsilon